VETPTSQSGLFTDSAWGGTHVASMSHRPATTDDSVLDQHQAFSTADRRTGERLNPDR